ncbi:DNA replication factor Cdt1-like [Leptidea sinapis]|uniref:CDT1 Geminin-binding domain-containing protein n=1 Tax=Leptidea sinapis TaxID=189913 RepID=A0A5E4R392_9NEOP|nr:DNA replication factor Cdt1-like [Leptidea sinapis]VVD05177.1 unnamed protein product [Leptidea sinapis]
MEPPNIYIGSETSLSSPIILPVINDPSPAENPQQMSKNIDCESTSSVLPLPLPYRHLANVVKAMDVLFASIHEKSEMTFSKLKLSIEEIMDMEFTDKLLGQILYLVPYFYNMKLKDYASVDQKYVISANIPVHDVAKLPGVLSQRSFHVHQILFQLVLNYHDIFLRSLDPPLFIPKYKVHHWHPNFDLENVPELEGVMLPNSLNQPSSNQTIFNPSLNNIPEKLLNWLKLPSESLESLTNCYNSRQKNNIYSGLPILLLAIHFVIARERRLVCSMEMIYVELKRFKAKVSMSFLKRDLKILTFLIPDWLTLIDLPNTTYVKIINRKEMTTVLKIIKAATARNKKPLK